MLVNQTRNYPCLTPSNELSFLLDPYKKVANSNQVLRVCNWLLVCSLVIFILILSKILLHAAFCVFFFSSLDKMPKTLEHSPKITSYGDTHWSFLALGRQRRQTQYDCCEFGASLSCTVRPYRIQLTLTVNLAQYRSIWKHVSVEYPYLSGWSLDMSVRDCPRS